MSVPPLAPLPDPQRERWPLALACALGVLGLVLVALVLVLAGGGGASGDAAVAAALPPPAPVAVTVPAPAPPATPGKAPAAPAKAKAPAARREPAAERRFLTNDRSHVRADWVAGFYRPYEVAARTFGVNWLLIASIHKQETAFSTSRGTYRGLNFARCCAGPMQFNVTNGPVSTWDRFSGAHRLGDRPAGYNNATDRHPSVYDDFDAIMAAAALLRAGGASQQLDANAWRAAYDYYGHDLTGVDYADQVLARAIGWGRSRFCINCEIDAATLQAVDAAWGGPVRAQLTAAEAAAHKRKAARERKAARKRGGRR